MNPDSTLDPTENCPRNGVHLLERPPSDTRQPWRPWLVRVATNARRDAWRRQKVREYKGPWLPSPVETAGVAKSLIETGLEDVEGRYQLLESVSFAFLLALEALTPQQRAVLLLRDVYDYSIRETAQALRLTPSNVKTTLHRARQTLAAYDGERRPPTPASFEQTGRKTRTPVRPRGVVTRRPRGSSSSASASASSSTATTTSAGESVASGMGRFKGPLPRVLSPVTRSSEGRGSPRRRLE